MARAAKRLREEGHGISRHRSYGIIGSVAGPAAKAKQRKWVRYGRIHPNAMRHADWHAMKDPRTSGLDPITCLDDASRRITGAALFKEAASVNAAAALPPMPDGTRRQVCCPARPSGGPEVRLKLQLPDAARDGDGPRHQAGTHLCQPRQALPKRGGQDIRRGKWRQRGVAGGVPGGEESKRRRPHCRFIRPDNRRRFGKIRPSPRTCGRPAGSSGPTG